MVYEDVSLIALKINLKMILGKFRFREEIVTVYNMLYIFLYSGPPVEVEVDFSILRFGNINEVEMVLTFLFR